MSIKGTKTEQNLLKAFAGESQASMRYRYFAKVAKKEGYNQISDIFLENAANEDQHAKQFFKFLEGGPLEITATYPAGVIGTTEENLRASVGGETEEWEVIYPEFAQIAKEEGFPEVARKFELVAGVEKHHAERFAKLLENLITTKVFEKNEEVKWTCDVCGYEHVGAKAVANCPVCDHDLSHQRIKAENY